MTEEQEKLLDAIDDYVELFGKTPLIPFAVDEVKQRRVIERAVARGEALDEDFDWWADLPDDAVG